MKKKEINPCTTKYEQVSQEEANKLIKFLETILASITIEIKDLNKGCCGYLAYKIAEFLLENNYYSFQFGVTNPLWSKTGLKAVGHTWIEIYIDDADTVKIVEINKGGKKKNAEFVRHFYMMPALKESLSDENNWAWGPSLTKENKSIIDKKLAWYMKTKTLQYAKDCDKAGELIAENIYACKILSDVSIIVPFTKEDEELILYKWVTNIESGKMDVIKEVRENGVLLTSLKEISFVGLLERYHLGQQKNPCGKLKKGKQIGCHSKVDCEYYKKAKK